MLTELISILKTCGRQRYELSHL